MARTYTSRSLVEDHRKLALAQLVFEKELGLTPMAFAALRGSQQPQLDLVGMMAAQSDAAETVEPEPRSESED